MKSFFNRILVPVLLNKDSAPIIEKAVDIANEFGCDIHLLHVHTIPRAFSFLQERPFTCKTFLSWTGRRTNLHQ